MLVLSVSDCLLEEDGTVAGSEAAEALEQSRAAEVDLTTKFNFAEKHKAFLKNFSIFLQQVEGPESSLKDTDQQSSSSQSEPAGSVTVADGKDDTAGSSDGAREAAAGGETANKFYCYICNITCHNQQVSHSGISV